MVCTLDMIFKVMEALQQHAAAQQQAIQAAAGGVPAHGGAGGADVHAPGTVPFH